MTHLQWDQHDKVNQQSKEIFHHQYDYGEVEIVYFSVFGQAEKSLTFQTQRLENLINLRRRHYTRVPSYTPIVEFSKYNVYSKPLSLASFKRL